MLDKNIENELKQLFHNKMNENYNKLIELAEMTEDKDKDKIQNANDSLSKILKYGTVEDVANGIHYHTNFLCSMNELEQYNIQPKIQTASGIKAQVS